jgi:photosystem II stability/assembly factor-like uncharacterized protein
MNSKLKYLLSFVIILCISIITQAESKTWTFCDSIDTGKEIIDIKCFDNENCMCLVKKTPYDSYYILRSTDEGRSWATVYQDTFYFKDFNNYHIPLPLYRISYVSENLCIVAGDSTLMLRSTDYGNSWSTEQSEDKSSIAYIGFYDDDYGVRLILHYEKENYSIEQTNDGALSWNSIEIPEEYKWLVCNNLHIPVKDLIFITARHEDYGPIIVHINTKENKWTQYKCGFDVSHNLNFIDKDVGKALINKGEEDGSTSANVYSTENGGIDWSLISVVNLGVLELGNNYIEINSVRGALFCNRDYGIAVGDNFTLLRTTDGGNTWIKDAIEGYSANDQGKVRDLDLRYITFPSPDVAYIATKRNIYKYQPNSVDVKHSVSKSERISIIPNPAIGDCEVRIQIDLPDISNIKVNIYNQIGVCVYFTEQLLNSSYSHNIKLNSNIFDESGCYYVQIIANDDLYIKKLIIIK